ncbi:MAG TPA: site-specific DNA-methyltransferase [Candidatus Acidoferrales bacterium]|jgi:adenine-specific DNA-methyltransferase|nr:site-specific DNA-methyltransferase [Candidatus Acidoferrales bacterium]
MKPLNFADPETKSADVVAENIEHLKELFPEIWVEGKVDFEVLKQLLGGAVDEREAKYGLNWHGKRCARQLALTPSNGTLRPCPEDSVEWDSTHNLMIEGDNLEVLKLLQKSYAGKVKLIYIDPPYNTGRDFVYPDNFQDSINSYLELTGQVDGNGNKISSNTEASGRFHTDWLNMMYPRLKLARNLLRDDGVLFTSIDDNEIDNITAILKEILGPENFAGCFIWEKRRSRENRRLFSVNHDYVVCATRTKSVFETIRGLLPLTDEARNRYGNPDSDPRGDWQSVAITAQAGHGTKTQFYTITTPNGRQLDPPSGNCWRFTKERLAELIKDNRIWFGNDGNNVPRQKVFLKEQDEGLTPHTIWTADEVGTTDTAKRELNGLFDGIAVFETPKPVELIRRVIEIGGTNDALVLDFFAGSGTTAEAVLRENVADGGARRYILVQLPEPLDPENKDQKVAADYCDKLGKPRTIVELTKERLRRAAKKIREENPIFAGDLGFRVFKLDSSNIQEWEPERENLPKTLKESIEHLKTNRTEEDILFELLLKLGLDLTVPIEGKKIAGKTAHSIGAGTLLVCLATKVVTAEVEPLALGIVAWHKQLAPAGATTVIFRDSAFADDVAKTNLTAILQQHGLENVRSL